MLYYFQLLTMALTFGLGHGARILVAPIGPKSHSFYLNAAAEELAVGGHEVYTIQPSYQEDPKFFLNLGFKVLKYHIPEGSITVNSADVREEMNDLALGVKSMFSMKLMPLAMGTLCEHVLKENFLEKLKALHFDIVLVDGIPPMPCMFLIPKLLNVPYVFVSGVLPWFNTRVPLLPSFVPYPLLPYSEQMTFIQRLANFAGTILIESLVVGLSGNMSVLLRKHIKDSDITWNDIISKSSLFFINRGPLLEWPAPSMPNTFYLEGLTARPAQPLSKEVNGLVEGATAGIVVVSFGSEFDRLPVTYVKVLMETFSQRPEIFLFRLVWENHEEIEIPDNVKLMSWLPQNDLLGHPKTKLFITHCGNNGQYEALYHGVPMIGFPLGGDQEHNAARIVAHGYGLSGKLPSLTTQELLDKINQVLDDKSYKKRTEKASEILRSKPMSARQTAAYWIEHVLEFGSDHLRSHAMDMPLYQYLMLDIMGFIISVVFICLFTVYKLAKILFRICVRCKVEVKMKTS